MQISHMLIDRSRGLSPAIALGVIEIECMYGEFTNGALEGVSTVQRLGCVITHDSIVVFNH